MNRSSGATTKKDLRCCLNRWIVERTFGWLIKQRRLSKDHEALCETGEKAMVYVRATIRLIPIRLET